MWRGKNYRIRSVTKKVAENKLIWTEGEQKMDGKADEEKYFNQPAKSPLGIELFPSILQEDVKSARFYHDDGSESYLSEQKEKEGKTIIVSNRLHMKVSIEGGQVSAKSSVGGLATGMKSVHADGEGLWIGWTGLTTEELNNTNGEAVDEVLKKSNCAGVPLTANDVENFYLGFSNNSLWPLFHYFLEYVEYDCAQWESYKLVNKKFADVVCSHLEDGDNVWIHDYQLLLLPQLIREKKPDVTIGFFLHIPFPSWEILRTFPWREEILEGMLGADLLGFHTHNYARHFISSVKRILDIDVNLNNIVYHERMVKVESFPMGIDYDRFYSAALHNARQDDTEKSVIKKKLDDFLVSSPDSKIILSIDRLDYTKGIPHRLKAFELFLDKYPEYKEKVRLVMLAVPSRSDVPQYQQLKCEVDELVGRINGKYATVNWNPIWYYYRSLPFENLIDLYTTSHIALITPVRDGMNLVAKEFVATRVEQDGVLILSEMAGAAKELTEALLINPYNHNQIADALDQALKMPVCEQKVRMRKLQKRVSRYNVEVWAKSFMDTLEDTKKMNESIAARKLNCKMQMKVSKLFRAAKRRLILLDYDGTIIGFKANPRDAFPDNDLLHTLDKLSEDENTDVCIVSGRDRENFEEWFHGKNYMLVTDHGAWYRNKKNEWEQLEHLESDWMEGILPVLENFSDKTPGTFVEVKQHSLAWHYRNADPELAEIRKIELDTVLSSVIDIHANSTVNGASNIDKLGIQRGNRVIEIKSSSVNKGRATSRLLENNSYDFILAAGDDWTDEYMFESLPNEDNVFTIKVGLRQTCAKYYIKDVLHLRKMLERISNQ